MTTGLIYQTECVPVKVYQRVGDYVLRWAWWKYIFSIGDVRDGDCIIVCVVVCVVACVVGFSSFEVLEDTPLLEEYSIVYQ
jgi:hypothetical protein